MITNRGTLAAQPLRRGCGNVEAVEKPEDVGCIGQHDQIGVKIDGPVEPASQKRLEFRAEPALVQGVGLIKEAFIDLSVGEDVDRKAGMVARRVRAACSVNTVNFAPDAART